MIIQKREMLDAYMHSLAEKASLSIGYPFATDFNYEELHSLLRYPLFNLGDPFMESNYGVNSFTMEREVIDFFADLFHAPKDNYSGYITSGGSESNLYGLYMARELHPNGIVYYSSDSHYSIPKSIRLLNMKSIEVGSTQNGEIDYDDLFLAVEQNRHLPAIIVANIGTTMTEAKDDLSKIRSILQKLVVESHYIHCDAALAGAYLPLLEGGSKFDFSNGADSIACSGHKFIGSPIPCGVVVVKKDNKERLSHYISYIESVDSTITGTRNGLSSVFLWYAIRHFGKEGLLQRAEECLSLAKYTYHRLLENNIDSYYNENAITVLFEKPSELLCQKWQLATKSGFSHLICMPGISKDQIDRFIEDVLNERENNKATF
ncbi:histidine decarboxylase [Chryseobacterium wanjuense]|jgi:histidine decarboxylase|nr:histidine decarboxylase [Chryseobacterium wanjuense]